MRLDTVDNGRDFDFGKTSENYAKYRDIYPTEFYESLYKLGVGKAGTRWLDIGTGTGVIPRHMAQHGADMYATDISARQIEQAVRLSAKEALPIHYAVRPAENSGFDENFFDTITACQCIMYFDKDPFKREILKIIKDKGLFIKTYMSFTKEDPIASKSKALISQFNPDWNASAPTKSTFFEDWFDNPMKECYMVDIPFTRETWHGRTLTMRGVQAQMDETTLQAFSKAHMQMLMETVPDSFTIQHKIFITSYKIYK